MLTQKKKKNKDKKLKATQECDVITDEEFKVKVKELLNL